MHCSINLNKTQKFIVIGVTHENNRSITEKSQIAEDFNTLGCNVSTEMLIKTKYHCKIISMFT